MIVSVVAAIIANSCRVACSFFIFRVSHHPQKCKTLVKVPEKTLEDWYYGYVERQQQRAAQSPAKPIRRIGIDELSLKKSTDSSSL